MTEAERREIQAKIDALPAGGITMKTINGKKYPYLQWTEDGKQRGRRVREEELETLRAGIEERKRLQTLLRNEAAPAAVPPLQLASVHRTGDALRAFIRPVLGWRKRDCFAALHDYLYGFARQGLHSVWAAQDRQDHHDPPGHCGNG